MDFAEFKAARLKGRRSVTADFVNNLLFQQPVQITDTMGLKDMRNTLASIRKSASKIGRKVESVTFNGETWICWTENLETA